MNEKIILFGGSFNPVHIGHVMLLKSVQKIVKAGKIIVMPSGVSPHKINLNMPSDKHRMSMCKLAFEGFEELTVSDFEISSATVSYTWLTVEMLKKEYPKSELYLLMGADMFLSFETWKNPDKIMQSAVICTVPRGEGRLNELSAQAEKLEKLGAKTLIVDVNLPNISSTIVRENIRKNSSIDNMVPKKVAEYIKQNNLYKG